MQLGLNYVKQYGNQNPYSKYNDMVRNEFKITHEKPAKKVDTKPASGGATSDISVISKWRK